MIKVKLELKAIANLLKDLIATDKFNWKRVQSLPKHQSIVIVMIGLANDGEEETPYWENQDAIIADSFAQPEVNFSVISFITFNKELPLLQRIYRVLTLNVILN